MVSAVPRGCDAGPWGHSGSALLPSRSLVTLVNGAATSLPGSCAPHPTTAPHSRGSPGRGGPHPFIPTLGALSCNAITPSAIPGATTLNGLLLLLLLAQHGGGTGHPRGPPGPRVAPSQRQQDEAPWPPCVRWGPALPREVSSKTSRRKALGGHPPFVGYCWPSVTCRGRGVTQAGVTRPANRTRGGRAGAGMRKALLAPGCRRIPRVPRRAGCAR